MLFLEGGAQRIRNGSPPAHRAIHSCVRGNLVRHTTLSAVRAICGQAKIGEAKCHHYGSVDISTTDAPIENQTKGCDSLRCNLLLTNGIIKFFGFKFSDFGH